MNQIHRSENLTPATALDAAARIAFIESGWHVDIVARSRVGFLAEMERQGVSRDRIDRYAVPGAFEIPLHALTLARGSVRRFRGRPPLQPTPPRWSRAPPARRSRRPGRAAGSGTI